jgi:hypothetical protein
VEIPALTDERLWGRTKKLILFGACNVAASLEAYSDLFKNDYKYIVGEEEIILAGYTKETPVKPFGILRRRLKKD